MTLREGYLVTEKIVGANSKISKYPLLPEDLLTWDEDEAFWWKECPGIQVGGFQLTDEQKATLKFVKFRMVGLNYKVVDE